MKESLRLCFEKARTIESEMQNRIWQLEEESRATVLQIEETLTFYRERLRAAELEITDEQSKEDANAEFRSLLEQYQNEYHVLLNEIEQDLICFIRTVLDLIDVFIERQKQWQEEFDSFRLEMQDVEPDEELLSVEFEMKERLRRCNEALQRIVQEIDSFQQHLHHHVCDLDDLVAEKISRFPTDACQREPFFCEDMDWDDCCDYCMECYSELPSWDTVYKTSYAPESKIQQPEYRSVPFSGFERRKMQGWVESCKEQPTTVNSSIFAPSEAKRGDYMMVQVFLYKDGEEQAVEDKAAEVDSDAQRRNYTPLSVQLKCGDVVRISLKMLGNGVEVEDSQQDMIWQGHYTDCQFAVFVSKEYAPSTMMGTVMLSINGVPCGRMMFKTEIVDRPQKLYAKIESKPFRKIFISYSSQDESKVKFIALAYKAQGVDYFFDRDYLKAGDVFPEKIRDYIDTADLFILCWSKNAADSYYVQQERSLAMSHAYPQKTMEEATLTIHPISIEPRTEYPQNMKDIYNFEVI